MKNKIALNVLILAAFAVGLGDIAEAQRMPQDNWFFGPKLGSGGGGDGQFNDPLGMAVGSDGNLYVADSGNGRIQVVGQNGSFVRKWTDASPLSIATDINGIVYVGHASSIRVYTPTGVFIRSWGTSGSGAGQFNEIRGIAVSAEGKVFAADLNNHRVQVFSSTGVFQTQWGSYGSAPGQFNLPMGLALGLDNRVYVVESGNNRIQVFEQDGTFVRQWETSPIVTQWGYYWYCFAVGPDGNLFSAHWLWDSDDQNRQFSVFTPDGALVRRWGLSGGGGIWGCAVSREGTIFTAHTSDDRIQTFPRSYRTPPDNPVKYLPLPAVFRTQQRAGTTLLDIDFRVTDADSPIVGAYPLAFADGVKDLAHVIPVATLVEGTAAHVGTNVTTGADHRLSWNAAADWSVNFGNVTVEILANDGRNLLGIELITIPASGGDPELTISRSLYTDVDFLNLWFWMLAKRDPSVTLVSGELKAVGGTYDGQVLASGTATTAAGLGFLCGLLNVREATTDEYNRARFGETPDLLNTWTPRFSIGPGDYPGSINAYGYDARYWAGISLVPLP